MTRCPRNAISPPISRCPRITVRKALDGLVADGLLVRRQGAGNFVSARVDKNFAMLTSFSEDMRARGRTPHSVWLKRAAGTVTPEEALALRLSPGTPVFRFNRIRYADDAPMALEYATIVATALPSLEAVDASLYEALERAGHRPVRALQRLRAVLLTGDQAELLKAKTRRCRPARRAAGLAARWAGDRVFTILLPWRHVRLRRRVERLDMSAVHLRSAEGTRMFQEAASASDAVRAQLQCDADAIAAIGRELRRLAPRAVITCARGSSDHAATYAKYLIETRAGVLTASAAPSVQFRLRRGARSSRMLGYRALPVRAQPRPARLGRGGQSGGGDDSGALQYSRCTPDRRRGPRDRAARRGRDQCRRHEILPGHACRADSNGRRVEGGCGAPIGCRCSAGADGSELGARLVGGAAAARIGRTLIRSGAVDWDSAPPRKTALKCKETCGLHAEAFSSAETAPRSLRSAGSGISGAAVLRSADATQAGVEALSSELARRGVPVLIAGAQADGGAIVLPTIQAAAEIAPILLVQSAYRLIATLAVGRGFDPDNPAHLRKVTETV